MIDEEVVPVKVALRVRPLSQKEVIDGAGEYLKTDQSQVIFGRQKVFAYDYVFAKTATQLCVYETAVRPLLNSLFKGYNATVLAYGQTGSGKTHTMGSTCLRASDTDQSCGIIPRVLNDLFDRAQELKDVNLSVMVSFVEIYNEEFKDLLCNSKQAEPLKIVEDNNSLKILNLTERVVTSVESTRELIDKGTRNRVVAATVMNDQSSRSHAIFTITLEQRMQSRVVRSKFHLVDLAGSERQSKTKAEGLRLKEGISINLGLLALGHVIRSLSEDDVFTNKNKHIPYRESKLTRLLKDSLGGNSVTLMIACVSPADYNMEETLNTLRFADRGRKMENKPVLNIKEIVEVEKPKPVKKTESKAAVTAAVSNMPVILEDEEEEEPVASGKRKENVDEKLLLPAKKKLKKEAVNFLLRNKLQCSTKALKRNVNLNTTGNVAATPKCPSSINKSMLSTANKRRVSMLNTTVASSGNAPRFAKKVLFPTDKINLVTRKFLQEANKQPESDVASTVEAGDSVVDKQNLDESEITRNEPEIQILPCSSNEENKVRPLQLDETAIPNTAEKAIIETCDLSSNALTVIERKVSSETCVPTQFDASRKQQTLEIDKTPSKQVLCERDINLDTKESPKQSAKQATPIQSCEKLFGSLSNNQCQFLFSQLVNQQENISNPFKKHLDPMAIFNGKLNK